MIFYSIFTLLAVMAGAAVELSRDLMMLQQNSYRPERYGRWLRESADSTSPRRLLGIVIFFIALSLFRHALGAQALMLIFGGITAMQLSRMKYKKPLAWTPRARRIYSVAALLGLLTMGAAAFAFGNCDADSALYSASVAGMGVYCASHCYMFASVWLLKPVEKSINARFYNAARTKLKSVPGLKIVGITGSYGKTSTKHYLYRILSEHFDTLMTPGSYNTTLGVVRTINEMLKPYNEVFIVEMGAKNVGDIKEICDLVDPQIGIVTAVGPQHLESFGSLENVCRTKFELIDALPADGLGVVNNDFSAAAQRKVANVECERYGIKNLSDGTRFTAVDIAYDAYGSSFTVRDLRGELPDLPLRTRLVGECNISNLLAAVAVARHMGVPDSKISYAVEQIEQVEHRLSIKRTPGGVTILDDAFNSNPVGSTMALEVLSKMPGRGIVVTPGMIELGEQTFELNAQLGDAIARCADVAIIVGHYNRDAITEGLRRSAMPEERVRLVDSFAEAQQVLAGMLRSGDVVLYENDLPDTFK